MPIETQTTYKIVCDDCHRETLWYSSVQEMFDRIMKEKFIQRGGEFYCINCQNKECTYRYQDGEKCTSVVELGTKYCDDHNDLTACEYSECMNKKVLGFKLCSTHLFKAQEKLLK